MYKYDDTTTIYISPGDIITDSNNINDNNDKNYNENLHDKYNSRYLFYFSIDNMSYLINMSHSYIYLFIHYIINIFTY